MRNTIFAQLLFAGALFAPMTSAEIIAARIGDTMGGGSVAGAPVHIATWTQLDAFENVAVQAILRGTEGSTGTAYLMTSIGPGTTVDDEIARTTITGLTSTATTVTLFSGLTLPPAMYFLAIARDLGGTGIGWAVDSTSTEISQTGDGLLPDRFAVFLSDYAPASKLDPSGSNCGESGVWWLACGTYSLLFNVSGDQVSDSPEPSTILLAAIGLAVLIRTHSTARRAAEQRRARGSGKPR